MSLDLRQYSDQLSNLCREFGVKRLEIFGSGARPDFKSTDSDLDFLVDFVENHRLGPFDRYFGLKEALERLFQRPVDLVEVRAIKNPYFRQAIEREKVLVYGT